VAEDRREGQAEPAARHPSDEREQEGLAGDHPAHLARGRPHRAQQRDLASPLRGRERERARDDEHRHEARDPPERAEEPERILALTGARIARVGVRCLAMAHDREPRPEPGAQARPQDGH
jgi:hypothetical protein